MPLFWENKLKVVTKINKEYIVEFIKQKHPDIVAMIDEPMKNHTYFKIGGSADIFLSVKNEYEIIDSISALKEHNVPFCIIGNGSNLLVSDKGIEGAVISVGKDFSNISCVGNRIEASAGALLSRISACALDNSLTGFEFASGIPGSLGGAIVMNAGAYDGEMKDVVVSTRYIDRNGEIKECFGDEHLFGYRKSRFVNGEIIVSSVIELKKGNKDSICEYMKDLALRRRTKQPLEYPSAGSTFKRPEGYFAAKLIDDAGLRGYRVGGAMVSDKHCGFVVNVDNASCSDVLAVMEHVKETVLQKFGVELEPEVRILGR